MTANPVEGQCRTNLTPVMLEDSIARMEKALKDAQMMIFPGGFSFGDEPEGSGKFIAAFMRNPILTTIFGWAMVRPINTAPLMGAVASTTMAP